MNSRNDEATKALKAAQAHWQGLLAERDAKIKQLERENALLRQKLDLIIRKLFGAQSEKLDPAQLLLLLQAGAEPGKPLASSPAAEEEAAPPSLPDRSSRPESHKSRERGPRLPEHLPVIEQVLDPEPVLACPAAWRCIGEEVSEQLDYEPGRFLRRRLIRRKYVRRSAGGETRDGDLNPVPIIAPLPACLQERSLPAPGLLAQILVAKYGDHLPLYRQEAIYRSRHGVHLPRQSLARWVGLAADWLRPIYEQIRTGVMGSGYVQIDETPVSYLAPGHGKTRQGYLWTCSRPRGDVVFDWQTSRAAACLEKILPVDFTGVVQCDGYAAYRSLLNRSTGQGRGRERGPITLAACWAHIRRKFHEALEQSPRTAGWLLRQIQHLYRVEAELRQRRAGPQLRAATRAWQSRPVQERIHRALVRFKTSRRYLPQSLLSQAIDYALGQWPHLHAWLADGCVEIDNNLVENAIRPTAIGKKNWLFIGDAKVGQRSAILYTIIESCRRRGIDPHAYLREVLTRLPAMTNWQIKDVTPQAWAAARDAGYFASASAS